MNLDLAKWQQFEHSNLQELFSSQLKENDAGTSMRHNF